MSSQKIYGLYGLKLHIVEIRWGVTMRDGRTNKRTTEDRATQPMEAGGWVSQYFWHFRSDFLRLFFDCPEMPSSSLLGKHLVSKPTRLVARLGRKVPSLENLDLPRRLLKVGKSGKKSWQISTRQKSRKKLPCSFPSPALIKHLQFRKENTRRLKEK